ncbi:MAG: PH domain-containing protein [Candidatus Omnitrophica bacterium]|nr:PH domain-containing protein [Candidatus Omnitrophota bacterium]
MMRPWNPGLEEQSKSRIPARIGFIGMLFITWLAVHGVATLEGCRAFLQQMTFRTLPLHVADNAANVAAAVWLKRATPPETVLAVHWAGALPYFYERKCIDLLGKNDRVIAHLPSRMTDAHAWIPGHDRWDYNYSLGELNPPVVVSTTPPRPFEEYGYRLVDQVNNFFILASGKNPDIQKDLEAGSPRASELYREFASRNESRIRGYLPRLTLSSLEQGLEPWLNPGEALMDATILVRDVYVFTSQRLLLLDRQKILDRNYEMVSIPFADILDFTIEETHRDDFTTRLKITLAGQKEPWIKDIRRHETAAEIFQKLNRFIHKQG